MKFKTEFFGASHMNGEIYPRTYAVGEDCPEDLLEAALEADAVEADEAKADEAKADEAKADEAEAKAEKKAKA